MQWLTLISMLVVYTSMLGLFAYALVFSTHEVASGFLGAVDLAITVYLKQIYGHLFPTPALPSESKW